MSAAQLPPLHLSEPSPGQPVEGVGARPVGMTGMVVFLAGVTVLFLALVIAYIVEHAKITIGMPALPWVFWISTFVVLLSSVFLNYAIQSTKLMHPTAAHRALLSATGLGYLFLGLQAPGLIMLAQLAMPFRAVSSTLYVLTFLLIALHLMHVVGGVAYLTVASLRSEKHHYESGDIGQLRPLSVYWHYLAVVWVLLFSMLLILN